MNYPTELRLLALDIASVTGFAILREGGLSSGSRDFRRGTAVHPGTPHAYFSNWIRTTISEVKPTHVIYEGSAGFFKSQAAVQICVGMRGVMLAECAKAGIPVVEYAAMTVKKSFTGSGKSDKVAMIREFLRRYPETVLADSNEADAVAIMLTHLQAIGIEDLQLLAT